MATESAIKTIKDHIAKDKVFVASKSYCPYCKQTKQLLAQYKDAKPVILELDELDDGAELQAALAEITGQRTVPNVFIGGKHIGGNSDLQVLAQNDELADRIKAAL